MSSKLLEAKFPTQHPSSLSKFSHADGGCLFRYWLKGLPSEYGHDDAVMDADIEGQDEEDANDHLSHKQAPGNSGRLRKMQSRPLILQFLLNGLGLA